MNRIFIIGLMSLISMACIFSCEKDDPTPIDEPDTTDTTSADTVDDDPPSPDYESMLLGDWKIAEATGNGNPDPSTTGKQLSFSSNGTYVFSRSFTGTWSYQADDHTLFVDANTQYENTWEIEELTDEQFIVTFNSPWDGGTPLRWNMEKLP